MTREASGRVVPRADGMVYTSEGGPRRRGKLRRELRAPAPMLATTRSHHAPATTVEPVTTRTAVGRCPECRAWLYADRSHEHTPP